MSSFYPIGGLWPIHSEVAGVKLFCHVYHLYWVQLGQATTPPSPLFYQIRWNIALTGVTPSKKSKHIKKGVERPGNLDYGCSLILIYQWKNVINFEESVNLTGNSHTTSPVDHTITSSGHQPQYRALPLTAGCRTVNRVKSEKKARLDNNRSYLSILETYLTTLSPKTELMLHDIQHNTKINFFCTLLTK